MGYSEAEMDYGETKIVLRPGNRWLDGIRRFLRREPPPPPPPDENVDFSLVGRLAAVHVKQFVEGIDTYQLTGRRTVQVLSHYQMPVQEGLQQQVPQWLSQRIRFGVVNPDGQDFRYTGLRAITMIWTPTSCELEIELEEAIAPGTRAFIAAYLGDGSDAQALRELPISSLQSV